MNHLKTTEQYIKLDNAYQFYNQKLFDNSLPAVLLTLQQKNRTAGYYCHNKYEGDEGRVSEIALNPDCFFFKQESVMQTLVHEMVHCWQKNHGTSSANTYHNSEWSEKMISCGLMPSSTGEPGGNKTGQNMSDYIIKGGIFEKLTTELLNKTRIIDYKFFTIWKFSYETTAEIAASGLLDISAFEGIKPGTLVTNDSGQTGTITNIQEGTQAHVTGLEIKTGQSIFIKIPEERNQQKKLKVKYSCPECGVNVWGKPDLNLICADCNTEFEDNSLFNV